MAKTYYEKLKDPRWQKKRLEVFNRDDFKCTSCKSAVNTLHVHHIKYSPNADPWDYSDDFLTTLCESCHQKAHGICQVVKEIEDQYAFLNPIIDQPNVITSINSQIRQLLERLSSEKDQFLQDEILKNVIYLRDVKDTLNG